MFLPLFEGTSAITIQCTLIISLSGRTSGISCTCEFCCFFPSRDRSHHECGAETAMFAKPDDVPH